MGESQSMKEKIINATIEIINSGDGNIDNITIRGIAEKAEIGVGMVNYHFQTKENLINISVQRIISEVIMNYRPNTEDYSSGIDRLKSSAKNVCDFIVDNENVSSISILQDHINPYVNDNTMRSNDGLMSSIDDIEDKDKKILGFALTSFIQNIFLRRRICKESFDFDFNSKKERDLIIDFLIDNLFRKE